jgi:hypothetical protein
MNTIQHEPLFTDLTPEQAAIIEGGVQYCPYTTRGVTSRLKIRSGPGTNYKIVGYWNPGEVKLLESPAIVRRTGSAIQFQRNTSSERRVRVHHSKEDKLKAQGLRVKLNNVHRAIAAISSSSQTPSSLSDKLNTYSVGANAPSPFLPSIIQFQPICCTLAPLCIQGGWGGICCS